MALVGWIIFILFHCCSHVIREMVETEKIYIDELNSILEVCRPDDALFYLLIYFMSLVVNTSA